MIGLRCLIGRFNEETSRDWRLVVGPEACSRYSVTLRGRCKVVVLEVWDGHEGTNV